MTPVMEEKDAYAELYSLSAGERAGEPAWLATARARALDRFQAQGFPTAAQEEWRFSSFAPITGRSYAAPSMHALSAEGLLALVGDDSWAGARLVFVNGRFAAGLSRIEEGAAVVLPLSQALARHAKAVEARFGTLLDEERNPFAALNTALFTDGAFIDVPANVVIDRPIHLVFIGAGDGAEQAHVRNLFLFGACAQCTIVETHTAASQEPCFHNVATEVLVSGSSNIDHYKLQTENLATSHVSTFRLWQDRGSVFRSHSIDFGGRLVRNTLHAKLDGEGCEGILNGLYVLDGNQHVDNFMWAEHCKENIPSHELYKGVLGGESSASFMGRIYVHSEAQKTDAKQTNQNLLLTDTARVSTKPQLEIYADDVKCTHGATVGQLDRNALFYLMARGIDEAMARNLLIHAFAGDIIERIRLEPLREKVAALLSEKLPKE